MFRPAIAKLTREREAPLFDRKTAREHAYLAALVDPFWYAAQLGPQAAGMSPSELAEHFLKIGLQAGISPSPLFPVQSGAGPTRQRLLGSMADGSAEDWFDEAAYLLENPDVGSSNYHPFEHFMRYGLREGRSATMLFDRDWYIETYGHRLKNDETTPFLHYLAFAETESLAPSLALMPIFAHRTAASPVELVRFGRVAKAARPWLRRLGPARFAFMASLFYSHGYDGNGELDGQADGPARFAHFLDRGLALGLDPGPLFQHALYPLQRKDANLSAEPVILHFLEQGNAMHAPTPFFNGLDYLRHNPDLPRENFWSFRHFVMLGIFEGRAPDEPGRHPQPIADPARALQKWQAFWTTRHPRAPLGPEIQKYVAALVDPAWYARQAGLEAELTPDALGAHFVAKGLDAGHSPSFLFPVREDTSTMRQRVLTSMAAGPAEGWFDAAAYLAEDLEIGKSGMHAFEHFIFHGLYEGRSPTPLFNPEWYVETYGQRFKSHETPPFLHYLSVAGSELVAPSLTLLPIFAHRTARSRSELERFGSVAKAARPWLQRLGPLGFSFLAGLFYSHGYDGRGELDDQADGPERFAHFLNKGLALGVDPGPLFQTALYNFEGKETTREPELPLLHFLEHGHKPDAPTALFDEADYLRHNLDLQRDKLWGFRHFVLHGIFEGRPINDVADLNLHIGEKITTSHHLRNWRKFWAAHDPNAQLDPATANFFRIRRKLQGILESEDFGVSLDAAVRLDPAIGDPRRHQIVIPPFHNPKEAARLEVLRRLPQRRYDAVICVPWLRHGGADLVACLLSAAVASNATRKVLLLRVDQPHCERPDWIPPEVDDVHISDVVTELPPALAEEFFYTLLVGLGACQVYNVNSNLCWRTFARFGARLARVSDLYAYLFCWDHDAKGLRVGYPSDFFAATAPYMAAIFTDTRFLRDELMKIYLPTAEIAERIVPLFSPMRALPESRPAAAETAAARRRERPLVLWAGRLDPQKRFDLAIGIAALMPDVDFECWGGAVLGKSEVYELPPNMKLNGFFKSFDELPLEDADAWLFTSDWEGMPTLIIELAVRGVSLVASAVGGVPELVSAATGFPVAGGSGPEAYVEALREALDNPQERTARAHALRALALSRHTREAYSAAIEKVLGARS